MASAAGNGASPAVGRLEGDLWIGGQFKLEIEVDRSANVVDRSANVSG